MVGVSPKRSRLLRRRKTASGGHTCGRAIATVVGGRSRTAGGRLMMKEGAGSSSLRGVDGTVALVGHVVSTTRMGVAVVLSERVVSGEAASARAAEDVRCATEATTRVLWLSRSSATVFARTHSTHARPGCGVIATTVRLVSTSLLSESTRAEIGRRRCGCVLIVRRLRRDAISLVWGVSVHGRTLATCVVLRVVGRLTSVAELMRSVLC